MSLDITEKQAIDLAAKPHLIIDAQTCNTVIGFMNAYITDLSISEWELEFTANHHHVELLKQGDKSVALKEAEWKISEQYKNWREKQRELRKFRAYRNALRRKEEQLQNSSKFIRNNYGNYPRVTE